MQKMIGKMAKMFPMLIAIGFMIVLISFGIGWSNSQTAAAYFSESKIVRETTLMADRVSIESVDLWLPYFKFLGIGFILGGIVMALRLIIDSLKGAGVAVLSNLPENKRPQTPEAPWYGKLMPMVMMLGMLIFIIAFVLSLQNVTLAGEVFSHPLPEIDAADAGSTLLGQLEQIKSSNAWLVPLKFFGIATMFLAITQGLATITFILNSQTEMISKAIEIGRSS